MQTHEFSTRPNSRTGGGPPATTLAVQGGFLATGTDKGEVRFQPAHEWTAD